MIIVNVLVLSALVLLAHAASAVGGSPGPQDDPRLTSEIQLGLGLMLSGFALDFVGITILGVGHLMTGASLTKALTGRVVSPGQVRTLGLGVAMLCFLWAVLTYAWRGLFPAPDSDLVGRLLGAFEAGNYNVSRFVSFGSGEQSVIAALMVASAAVLLVAAVLSSYFLQRVAVPFRTARKFHLTQWPLLAIVNLASSALLAASLGGTDAPSVLGAIAGGGLKLLLVPTLGITVYLSVYRNFQELSGATVRFDRPVVPAAPLAPTARVAAASPGPSPPVRPQPIVAAAPRPIVSANAPPSPSTPRPTPAPVSAVVPALAPVDPAPRPVAELTDPQIAGEIQRHEAAIRHAEDLYLSGQIEVEAYADAKGSRKARLEELRRRLHRTPAVPQPTLVIASPAPAEEIKPAVSPTLPPARSLDLAPSTRPVKEMTMEQISEEIAGNQKAVATVEEMVRAEEIDPDVAKQVVATRRARTLELQTEYEELRFDMLTAEPVPEEPAPLLKEGTDATTEKPILLPPGEEPAAAEAQPTPSELAEPEAPAASTTTSGPEAPIATPEPSSGRRRARSEPAPTAAEAPTSDGNAPPPAKASAEGKAEGRPRRSRRKRTEEPGNG